VPARESGFVVPAFLRNLAGGGALGRRRAGADTSQGPVEVPVLLEPHLGAALLQSKAKRNPPAGAGAGAGAAAGGGVRRLPCEVTPDGRHLILGGHADGSVKIFRVDSGGPPICSAKVGQCKMTPMLKAPGSSA